jgi:hypothetical protein
MSQSSAVARVDSVPIYDTRGSVQSCFETQPEVSAQSLPPFGYCSALVEVSHAADQFRCRPATCLKKARIRADCLKSL